MKIRIVVSLLCLAVSVATATGAEARVKKQKPAPEEALPSEGPEIQVPGTELEHEMADEEGLKRLGTFGRFHLFGYGELHYNGRIGPSENEIDFHRLVLGVGYDFTDWLLFRAEVDFEHAFQEPELEFAYLDFLIRPWFNARVGSLLVPAGVINQHHEPPLFYSVERPEFYRVIIPTTWQEGAAGFHGKFGPGMEYELYGMSMPDAHKFAGSTGIRGGRGKVGEQIARDFGVGGRLAYKGVPGLRLGTSFVLGNTGQGDSTIDGAFLSLIEADAKYSIQGIDIEGAFAFVNLTDAGNINTVRVAADPNFSDFVGSQMMGFYVEGAYHVLHRILPETKHDVVVFGRFEDFNTQHTMPAGFAANPANDRNTVTAGVSYLPIPQVAIKADYMFNWNEANAGVDQFNLGVGFYY
jgi:hypothetical protein